MTPIEKYFPEKVARAFRERLSIEHMEQLIGASEDALNGIRNVVGMTRYMIDKTIDKATTDYYEDILIAMAPKPKRSHKKKVK